MNKYKKVLAVTSTVMILLMFGLSYAFHLLFNINLLTMCIIFICVFLGRMIIDVITPVIVIPLVEMLNFFSTKKE